MATGASFSAKQRTEHGHEVLYLAGSLTIGTAEELRTLLHRVALESDGDLHLDFSSVTELDAAGLGAMVSVARLLRQRDTKLTVRSLKTEQNRLLRMSGLNRLIAVEQP